MAHASELRPGLGALSWAVEGIQVPGAQGRNDGSALVLEVVVANVPAPGKPSVQGAKSGTHAGVGTSSSTLKEKH
jgi:hypothetical protein